MKNVILLSALFLISTTFTSCDNEPCCVNLDVGIDIFPVNKDGDNLLDKSVAGYINPETLSVSYLIGGKVVSAYDRNLDCASSLCERSEGGKSWLSLLPNISETELFPITYIHWSPTDTDTLKCEIYRHNGLVRCDRIWYNEILVYPAQAPANRARSIIIVK